MERRICKRCGKVIYFNSDFCLMCKDLINIEKYEKMTDLEISNIYNRFSDILNKSGKLSNDNEKELKLLLTANDNINPKFQMTCIDNSYWDIPQLFYKASKQVHDKIVESFKGLNPSDKKVNKIFDALAYSFGYTYDTNGNNISKLKTCKELVCIQNDLKNEEDFYSRVTLKIIDNDNVIEIQDALNCIHNEEDMPYELLDVERVDTGKHLIFKTVKEVSALRSTFNDNYSTMGGFVNEYIDLTDIKCDCGHKECSHIAQISCNTFINAEGVLIISKCLKCGNYMVNYFTS